jgi:hypothetical protein
MARVRIGLTCGSGHFNHIGDLWEPVKDKDCDKLAERARLPVACEYVPRKNECGKALGLPHVEGREREADSPARIGGHNLHAGLQQGSPERKRGPLTDSAWKRAVFEAQREHSRARGPSLCAVTGEPLSFDWDDAHHILEKRLLHAQGLDHIANDPRNGMFIKSEVHAGQTSGMARIPREKVPERAWEYAREIGSWAVARLESDYPPSP